MLKPVRAAVVLFTGRHCRDSRSGSDDDGAIVVRCWRGMNSLLFTGFVFFIDLNDTNTYLFISC